MPNSTQGGNYQCNHITLLLFESRISMKKMKKERKNSTVPLNVYLSLTTSHPTRKVSKLERPKQLITAFFLTSGRRMFQLGSGRLDCN
jgi:hypothetical protein